MTKANYNDLISQCDAAIRAGEIHKAIGQLTRLDTARVPREFRLPLATLCRRAGVYTAGLLMLGKLIRPSPRSTESPATSAEMAEYAVLLLRVGTVAEAVTILEQLDPGSVPEVRLYRAFSHFYRWQFEPAIEELKLYLTLPLSNYARSIGRTNLANALVESGHFTEALALIEEILIETRASGNIRLQSNCLAMRAQVFLRQANFSAARADFESSFQLAGSGTRESQYITKWRLILEGLENNETLPFDKLRRIAAESQDWESIRDSDLFSLKVRFDKVNFLHLLFGTPFAGFRQRICHELGSQPDRKTYVLGPKNSPRMDLMTATVDGDRLLKPGDKCHQLLEVLLRDFYAPLRIGGLFNELFTGEHFDVASSPNRVHQIVHRTRKWLEVQRFPVEIAEQRGFFKLVLNGPFSFAVPFERQPVNMMTIDFARLAKEFARANVFSAKEAQVKLRFSKSKMRRLINWGVDEGKLERLGRDNSTVYALRAA